MEEDFIANENISFSGFDGVKDIHGYMYYAFEKLPEDSVEFMIGAQIVPVQWFTEQEPLIPKDELKTIHDKGIASNDSNFIYARNMFGRCSLSANS